MKATPNLVPIIENRSVLENFNIIVNDLSCFRNYDLLVLGCTHYPVLKSILEDNLNTKTLDMGEVLSNSIKLDNNSKYNCELYFSMVSVNLISNINNILTTDYKIYIK